MGQADVLERARIQIRKRLLSARSENAAPIRDRGRMEVRAGVRDRVVIGVAFRFGDALTRVDDLC